MDYERLLDSDEDIAAKAANDVVHDAVWEDISILPRGTPFQAAKSRLPEGLADKLEERMAEMQNANRNCIIHMLGRAGGDDAVDLLRRVLVQQLGEGGNVGQDKMAVYHAIHSLSQIGGLRAFQMLLGLQEHPDKEVAIHAGIAAQELFIGGTTDYTEPSIEEMERTHIFMKRWATVPADIED